MKRLFGIAGLLLTGLAWGQVNPGFLSGQVLTAGALNQAFLSAAATANGSLTNPTITGGTAALTSLSTTQAPSFGAPVPLSSGGTGQTTAAAAALALGVGTTSTPTFFGVTLNGSTANGVVVGGGNGVPVAYTTAGTTGQVLVGATGTTPAFGTTVQGLTFTSTIHPQTTGGIAGTVAGDNAAAGSVGEVMSTSATGTSLTTGVIANCASLSLTAGDWDVEGVVAVVPAASTTVSQISAGISTTSATYAPANTGATTFLALGFTTGQTQVIATPVYRVNVASTTPVYLVSQEQFGVSTLTCSGFIRARRTR